MSLSFAFAHRHSPSLIAVLIVLLLGDSRNSWSHYCWCVVLD